MNISNGRHLHLKKLPNSIIRINSIGGSIKCTLIEFEKFEFQSTVPGRGEYDRIHDTRRRQVTGFKMAQQPLCYLTIEKTVNLNMDKFKKIVQE